MRARIKDRNLPTFAIARVGRSFTSAAVGTSVAKRVRSIAVFAIVVGLIAATAMWALEKRSAPPRQSLVIADAHQVMSALIYVAQAKGYFAEQGLEVALSQHATGRDALTDLLKGGADLAVVGETPVARAIQQDEAVAVLAAIQSTDRDMALVMRPGVRTPADLAGKTIGYIAGTGSEMFLDLFLSSHNLADTAVRRVAVPLDDALAALAEGRIDGLSAWITLRFAAERVMPAGTTSLAERGIYTKTWVLAARRETVAARRRALEGVLRALIRAERLVEQEKTEAIAITARHLGLDIAEANMAWPYFDFAVEAGQPLVVALENAALKGSAPANVLRAIELGPLLAVDPLRVTVPR